MIDAAAVLERLRETDARSGGHREAWTEPWLAERRELDAQARAVSDAVTVERDAYANTWYVLPGRRTETILIASHSGCVPGGGWLDGILGVQAGLGMLVATATRGQPERTLAVVDWADEEGTRFGRSLLGSSAATGALSSAELVALAGADGCRRPLGIAADGRAPEPVRAAAALLTELFAAAQDAGGLATAGELSAEPSLITAVPARCRVGLDLRHAELTALDALERRARKLAADSSCPVEITDVYDQDPIHFDPSLVRAAGAATDGGGDSLMSGPLHDSAALAQAGVPAAMLFVASIGGISHTRDEDSAELDLVAGLEALYRLTKPLLAGETRPWASRRDG